MTSQVEQLVAGLGDRKVRDIARAITLVENGGPDGLELLALLASKSRNSGEHVRSQTIGITGSPGVGKSTMTSALIAAYRDQGKSVAVLAVDPSSPFSGGALLGDRIRMQAHSSDTDVFIRSMASRGHLGGLAAASGQVLRVLDAAGFDVVLIETVGVGQSEVEVAAAADTTLVLVAPGMGDGIQAAKAGILEIGDIFVVNKADRDGAQSTARDLRQMINLASDDGADAHSIADHGVRAHGFWHETRGPRFDGAMRHGRGCIARQDCDLAVWIGFTHPRDSIQPVHAGHLVIQQDEVELSCFLDLAEGFIQALGSDDIGQAFGFEEMRESLLHQIMIIRQ